MRHEVWAARLSSVWDVGIIVLGSDHTIDFANERARALLQATSAAELARRGAQLSQRLRGTLRAPTNSHTAPAEVTVTMEGVSPDQNLRIQVYDIAEEECLGHLLVLQQEERAAAIEAALLHAAQDRGLSSLSRHLAHDLKGSLNVISMNVEILSRVTEQTPTVPSNGVAVAMRCATVARRELGRLDQLLTGLLNRDGVVQSEPTRIDMCAICRALAELVAARASHQGVAVTLQASDEPAEVVGLGDQLHAALLNLIVNALDAMPRGGSLCISVTPASQTVRIAICDTGSGIDAHTADEIWRLYYTTKPGGTGIGLYVTRVVAEAHGGRVSHYPNAGGGSCFAVDLPAAPAS
jgi:signal transduction histidine kinase